jgi:hypothetical protein
MPASNSKLVPNCGRHAGWAPASRTLGAHAALVVAKLRNLAPYAAMELVLPGGSLMALLFWLYRRQRNLSYESASAGADQFQSIKSMIRPFVRAARR